MEKHSDHVWMARAGESAYLIDDFLSKNIVAIGWHDLERVPSNIDYPTLKESVRQAYPFASDGNINSSASQIYKFVFQIQVGDNIVTYQPSQRKYFIGRITSEYRYDESLTDYHNIRNATWLGSVQRDSLSTETRNSLGSTLTIFELSDEVKDELFNLLNQKSPLAESQTIKEDTLEFIKEDFQQRSYDFITDKISALSWENMQELVAGIIRAMGYKTRISPTGPDRGKDIIASPDGLGLEEPRIIVEVKHRKGSIGAPDIRNFIGGLRSNAKGLYISTGGFTNEGKYEAERANFPITLIDANELTRLLIDYYDNCDAQTKAPVPLKKIYWPA
jgi:restriction system protein